MAPTSLKIKKNGIKAFAAQIKALTQSRVLVGIPSSTTDREPEPGEKETINNATIGFIMENGAPEMNIPARPWLGPGVKLAEDNIAKRYKAGAQAILDGKVADAEAVHTVVGLETVATIKKHIVDGPFVSLAESTLAERRRRGRTGTKPLNDSSQFRNSVNFVVRPTKDQGGGNA